MNIPPYWAKVSASAGDPDGMVRDLTAWGWSLTDRFEAERKASDRLARMVDRVRRGESLPSRYPYGAGALREQILDEIREGDAVRAVMTRNSYGCVVINAPDVMFIDVDVAPPTLGERIRRLWSPGKDSDQEAVDRMTAALSASSKATFRLYRTAGGFRLIAVDRTFAPGSKEAEAIMAAVGADPAYVQLCRAQQSFRARVSPKPWRCQQPLPPGRHPRELEDDRAFAEWLRSYERSAGRHASCRFITQVGGGRAAAGVTPVLDYHDGASKAHQQLPLA